MKIISDTHILEFRYDSGEERLKHVELMKDNGYECDGVIRKSDDSIMSENREWYWYARFSKQK